MYWKINIIFAGRRDMQKQCFEKEIQWFKWWNVCKMLLFLEKKINFWWKTFIRWKSNIYSWYIEMKIVNI